MSDNPKLTLKADETVLITLKKGKPFSEGVSQYGKWFGYNVIKDNVEHTFFADEDVHSAFQTIGRDGARFNITLKYQGKQRRYVVREALNDERGERFDQPKSVQEPSPEREAYRANRVQRIVAAIEDTKAALTKTGDAVTPELLQKYVATLLIEEQRKG